MLEWKKKPEELGIDGVISLGREGKKPARAVRQDLKATLRMAARLETDEGRAIYRKRKGIVEPVVGWIKEIQGFRRFSLRGLKKTTAEWNLVCLATNLKRMHRMVSA